MRCGSKGTYAHAHADESMCGSWTTLAKRGTHRSHLPLAPPPGAPTLPPRPFTSGSGTASTPGRHHVSRESRPAGLCAGFLNKKTWHPGRMSNQEAVSATWSTPVAHQPRLPCYYHKTSKVHHVLRPTLACSRPESWTLTCPSSARASLAERPDPRVL